MLGITLRSGHDDAGDRFLGYPPPAGERAELVRMVTQAVVPAGAALAIVLTGYALSGHVIEILLQDRDTAPGSSEWSGFLTFIGCGALATCTGAMLGALALARARHRATAGAVALPPAAAASFSLGILLLIIAFDDVFMVHDAILPGFGIPEDAGLACYAVIGCVLFLRAFPAMRREGLAAPFVGALALLAVSLAGDTVESLFEDSRPFLAHLVGNGEDITKFLAYAALCHLCLTLARRIVVPVVASVAGEGAPDPEQVPVAPRAADADLTKPIPLPR